MMTMTPLSRVLTFFVTASAILIAVSQCARADSGDSFNLLVRPAAFAAAAPMTVKPGRGVMQSRAFIIPIVDAAADRHGVPRRVLHALVKRESGYNPYAVGPPTRWGRACGMTQFIPPTAALYGVTCRQLLGNPTLAADIGARYLRQGYDRTGSWAGAAAYYHGGPNRRLHGRKTAQYALAVSGGSYSANVSVAFAPGLVGNSWQFDRATGG